MKTIPFFKQPEQMDCGPTYLQMVAKHFGKNFSLQRLREISGINRGDVSLLGISEAAEKIGFRTYYDGIKITTAKIPFIIDIYSKKQFTIEGAPPDNSPSLILKYAKVGVKTINNQQFLFRIRNQYLNLYKNGSYQLTVTQIPVDSANNNSYLYNFKDTLEINNSRYKIDSLTTEMLYLRKLSDLKFGSEKNANAPEIIGNDVITNQPFSLKKKRGVYVLLDFWGTWCKPCMEALPELVSLHDKYKNKEVQFVSLALDGSSDLDKLKKVIKENNLNWNQLFINKDKPSAIVKDYKVSEYPTTILIDPKGVIRARGTSAKILKEIDKILEQKLKN